MKLFLFRVLSCVVALTLAFTAEVNAADYAVTKERVLFPAQIDGRDFQLECMLYRPIDTLPHPLVIFSHGRNGIASPRDANLVYGYSEICDALARLGHVVAYVVRRGYGNSEGPDTELQDTAVLSGLEAAKDYKAAVEYWRTKDFVLPAKVLLMGQSQGGWAVLACTNVEMSGVLGVVNISGGTNYRLMGTGAVTSAVQDHWVAGCADLGRGARVPSFWIYSENDLSISGDTARRMFTAFTANGGVATMLMLPPYGSNGHGIVGQPDLFMAQMKEFFATIGFVASTIGPPTISAVDAPSSTLLGETVVLTVSVTGEPSPTLQWRRDGANLRDGGNLSGATTRTLTIRNTQASDAGSYTVVATNSAGTVISGAAMLVIHSRPGQHPIPNGDGSAQIINLSTRGIVSTGENVLIAGFVISGPSAKKLLVVASGLNLTRRFGLTGEIGRPRLVLHRHSGSETTVLSENNDWQTNASAISEMISQAGAQPLSASSDPAHGDAALIVTLMSGVYSVVVAPDLASANQNGIGLVELYDLSPQDGSRLTNISARGSVEGGDRQMIVGVVVSGTGHSRLMLRSVGPGLRAFGIENYLTNPLQYLHRHSAGQATVIESNDDWSISAQADQIAVLNARLGAFPLEDESADSVILTTLVPGVYSSVVADRSGKPGVVLTEIYDANEGDPHVRVLAQPLTAPTVSPDIKNFWPTRNTTTFGTSMRIAAAIMRCQSVPY